MTDKYFNRKAIVLLGEINKPAFKVFEDLRITFSISKFTNDINSTATIEIYNLTEETQDKIRAFIYERKVMIIVQVGYLGMDGFGELSTIFKGTVSNFQGRKTPPNTVSTFYAFTRLNDIEKPTVVDSHYFPIGTKNLSILQWLIENSEGNKTLEIKGDKNFGELIKGVTYTKTIDQHLREWMRNQGCQYVVDGSKVVVMKRTTNKPTHTNLKAVDLFNGMIGSPTITLQGATFETVIRPELKLLDWVRLDTSNAILERADPHYAKNNKDIKATEVRDVQINTQTIIGDTHGQAWSIQMEGFKYDSTN